MKMKITERYITFGQNPDNNVVTVNMYLDGNLVEQIFSHLGEGDYKYKFFVDVTEYIGKEMDIEIVPCASEWRREPEGELDQAELDKRYKYIKNEANYTDDPPYSEKYRPLVHYSTQRGWVNDPNGCIYYDGLYHLYYQHCPGANYGLWDNNHWGHAVSTDLFNWVEKQPVLRYPHESSGTGFINRANGKVNVTTSYRIYESDDGGFSYHLSGENTVGNGDPKFFYHEETGKYISITLNDLTSYIFASSPDLVNWQYESKIDNFRECPEMCRYKIEETGEEKWVLNGGDGAYILGQFDGHEFIQDPIDPDRIDKYVHIMEVTKDFNNKYNGVFINENAEDRFPAYAHQIFDNAPDGRIIRIAWYAIDFDRLGMPFNQCMTVPQELKLKMNTGFGLRLCAMPVKEIKKYYISTKESEGVNPKASFETGKAFDAEVCFDKSSTLKIRDFTVSYNESEKKLYINPPKDKEFTVPFVPVGEQIKLRAVFDIMAAEFFFGEGEVYIPYKPDTPDADGIEAAIEGNGKISVSELTRSVGINS